MSALESYTETLAPRRVSAEAAGVEGAQLLELIANYSITTSEEYASCGELLREVKGQIKVIDEERKVSVTPLNSEVARINDWFRPALESRKKFADHITRLMGAYVLQQRERETKLLVEAQAAARMALAGRNGGPSTEMLVSAAAETAAPKVQGVSEREVFTFEIVDAMKLERRFLMPDIAAIGAWVKSHGLEDVPAGVEVKKDVRFTVRS